MKVYIQMLRSVAALRKTLEADGWRLEAAHEGTVRARHPHLRDEADFRGRLHGLGLLTSSALRIEFAPAVAERSDPAA
ncbi:MAG TPA: hypothetical protein VKA46_23305 [Gemmataceae bacterium]|nr:hypothetical protein [Gemmataceae bacterium]